MINLLQLKDVIIVPSLRAIELYSEEATEMLIMIAAWESKLGTYLKQEGGPALGPWMMEPKTHDEIWLRVMPDNIRLTSLLMNYLKMGMRPESSMLSYNLRYACCMARIFLKRIPVAIPKRPEDMAEYAKKYWNTVSGKATPENYLKSYNQAIGVNPSEKVRKA